MRKVNEGVMAARTSWERRKPSPRWVLAIAPVLIFFQGCLKTFEAVQDMVNLNIGIADALLLIGNDAQCPPTGTFSCPEVAFIRHALTAICSFAILALVLLTYLQVTRLHRSVAIAWNYVDVLEKRLTEETASRES